MIQTGPLLLLIETSTEVCSVAICAGEKVIGSKVSREPKSHARVVAPMVNDLLGENSIDMNGIDAVVVSEGPGSYTGLRVGVSLAKGLCFGSSKPLISVGSVELLYNLAIEYIHKGLLPGVDENTGFFVIPMIDARRMEVYTAVYNEMGEPLEEVQAKVLDEGSFKDYIEKRVTIFCGDGSGKVKDLIKDSNALFIDIESVAWGMIKTALNKYQNKKFEDVAYFEPFYLKDFIAGVSKKGALGLPQQ
ncbi:MAG: tRNA (adenosine(37)-N6)-threonylcarbamoyltransferase complex dimerization subunit type 1 TsaB [Bacteroidales bacterium]